MEAADITLSDASAATAVRPRHVRLFHLHPLCPAASFIRLRSVASPIDLQDAKPRLGTAELWPSSIAPRAQRVPDGRPFEIGDAVQHRIVQPPIGKTAMIAQHTLAAGAEFFDRPLRAQIAGRGFQLQPYQMPLVEGMPEQQVLDRGVQTAAMLGLVQPGPA